jgi:hypothetical protein
MNNFFRGLIFGIVGLFTGFVGIFIGLAIASAALNSQTSGHTMISLHFTSPIGMAALAFLAMMFFAGFSFGARRHSAQTH